MPDWAGKNTFLEISIKTFSCLKWLNQKVQIQKNTDYFLFLLFLVSKNHFNLP